MIYQVRCNAHVTIFQEEVISVSANSEAEAKEIADAAFRKIMDEKYGWADLDDVHFEEVKVC